MSFKERSHLPNIKRIKWKREGWCWSCSKSSRRSNNIISEDGYPKLELSSVDKRVFYWKKMPPRTCIASKEKSVPGFKDSKDRLTLLLGANAGGDLKLKLSLTYLLKILVTFRIMLNLPCLCSANGTTKSRWQHICLQHWLPKILNPLLRPAAPTKGFLSRYHCSLRKHPRALMEKYNEIHVIFTPANTASVLQPTNQGVVMMFNSWCLGNSFCRAIAATNSDSSDGSGQSQLKTF